MKGRRCSPVFVAVMMLVLPVAGARAESPGQGVTSGPASGNPSAAAGNSTGQGTASVQGTPDNKSGPSTRTDGQQGVANTSQPDAKGIGAKPGTEGGPSPR